MADSTDLQQEKLLIEAAQQDSEQFMHLYDKYFDQIYRYIYRRVGGNPDVAHDIGSQTFLDALDNLKSYTFQGYPFSSWLYKIAHNNVIKWYRKTSKHQIVPLDEAYNLSDKTQDTKEEADGVLAQEQISEMMQKLDEDEQEILRLKFFEGLSNIEIADIMELSVSNIGVKVFRTLKKAKGLLPTKHDLKQLNSYGQ